MFPNSDSIIRLLTIATLSGLLFGAGLGLRWREVTEALRQCRLVSILALNFFVSPALAVMLLALFALPVDEAAAIVILAAAPFAPVVPTFTRLARADMALAVALTGLFPLVSAFVTPLICALGFRFFPGEMPAQFNFVSVFVALVSTITLPLAGGILVRQTCARNVERLQKVIQIVSEAIGAIALIYILITEFETIRSTGWRSLAATVLVSELSFLLGYMLGGPAAAARFVVAVGSANRNIALALLVAIQSHPNSPVVGKVVANGLLLILLGLLHVGIWRLLILRKRASQ